MGGVSADMVFTDPPYNVNYKGQGEKTKRGIENDNMDDASFTQFLGDFFKSAEPSVKNGAGWYVFHSSTTQDQFKIAMEEAGLIIRTQLIWNKPTSALGWGDYMWKHEPFYYAGKKGKLVFYGDRTHKTIFDFHATEKELIAWVKREKRLETMGLSSIWTMKRDPMNEYVHPTQKPVELITYAMVNSSKAGDVVLDPFGGSGSVIIAAEKSDRVGYSIELDPTFVDIIVQRYVDYTKGGSVTKNGQPDEWNVSTNIENLEQGADEVAKGE
jgi:DNA modification methylase